MRIPLDDHELVDLDASVGGHAAHVVAGEVHQHHVLGALFLVGQEISLQSGVFGLRLAAASRAGDGTRDHPVPLHPNQRLGRRTRYLDGGAARSRPEAQEVHVRAGVERPQRPVRTEGRTVQIRLESSRGNHLEDVARHYVLFGFLHPAAVALVVHRRGAGRLGRDIHIEARSTYGGRQQRGHLVATRGGLAIVGIDVSSGTG